MFVSHGIDCEIFGFPAITGFAFKNNHDLYRKFITQEMLKSNILAGSIVYASVSQTESILNSYFDKFYQIIKKISYCEHGSDIKKYLNAELI